jgi:hypothetical protein
MNTLLLNALPVLVRFDSHFQAKLNFTQDFYDYQLRH